MSISEKIKTIDNKIEQSKSQYKLDRQTAKLSALLSGNVNKYEFLTGKDAALKRFKYSPLGKELKAQASAAENTIKN